MKQSFVMPIMSKVARALGCDFVVEPRYGYVARLTLPDGRTRYMRNTVFDLNGAGATEVAKDKDYASFFLKAFGYPVPIGNSFHTRRWSKIIRSRRTPEAAWRYAQRIGLPVIVKPNAKSQGAGVAVVRTKREFFSAVAQASKNGERVFLVQKPVRGRDYRIVVLDGDVISAYERTPLTVTGDGRRSVHSLMRERQREFARIGRDTTIPIRDPRITTALRRLGLTRKSVPEKGRRVVLLPNANLSTGGDARDVTSALHPEWKRLSANIARDMNLRYVGIDVMTPLCLEDAPSEYVIIEVNAAPGLDNYASIGETQAGLVEHLYRRVFLALAERDE